MPKPIPKDKAKARVAVAKDVIKRIQMEKLRVEQMAYVRQLDERADPPATVSEAEKECQVCALGASLLSFVRLYDNFDMSAAFWYGDITDSVTRAMLGKVFDEEQLDLVEAAFECEDCLADILARDDVGLRRAIRFGERYDNHADRLLAIMQNIVDHEGTFDPSVEYEIVR